MLQRACLFAIHQSISAKEITAVKEFRTLDILSFQNIPTNTEPCGKGGVGVWYLRVCMDVLSLLFLRCTGKAGAQGSSASESDSWHLLDSSDEQQKLLAEAWNPVSVSSLDTRIRSAALRVSGSPTPCPPLLAPHPPWDKR